MGGFGSGWQGPVKQLVDDGLILSIGKLHLRPMMANDLRINWSNSETGEPLGNMRFDLMLGESEGIAIFKYRLADAKEIQKYPIRITSTPLPWNRQRWWWICPLSKDGVACCRRVSKLYLPHGSRFFGCRKCHELTYRTSQQAHSFERFLKRLGISG